MACDLLILLQSWLMRCDTVEAPCNQTCRPAGGGAAEVVTDHADLTAHSAHEDPRKPLCPLTLLDLCSS